MVNLKMLKRGSSRAGFLDVIWDGCRASAKPSSVAGYLTSFEMSEICLRNLQIEFEVCKQISEHAQKPRYDSLSQVVFDISCEA